MKHFLTLIIFALVSTTLFAQDKILFMDGKEKEGTIDTLTGDFIRYFKPNGKDKFVHPNSVFSITYKDGKEEVLYKKNLLTGNDLSIKEARSVVNGARLAYSNYKPILPSVAAFGSGLLVGNKYGFFGGSLASVAIDVPFILFKPKVPKSVSETDRSNDDFVYGYRSTAGGRKILYTVVSSMLGSLTGALIKDNGTEFFK